MNMQAIKRKEKDAQRYNLLNDGIAVGFHIFLMCLWAPLLIGIYLYWVPRSENLIEVYFSSFFVLVFTTYVGWSEKKHYIYSTDRKSVV